MTPGDAIAAWVRSIDWPRVGCVVVVGDLPEVVTATRHVRPQADVIVLDLVGTAKPPEGVTVVRDLIDLRTAVSVRKWPQARIELAVHPELRGEWAPDAARAVDEGDVLSAQRHLTEQVNAHNWVTDGLEAIPHLFGATPITALKGVAEGATGILVGSGPSLSSVIDLIAEAQGHVVIAACQGSLPALERAGIVPHIVCAVEHIDEAYNGLEGLSLWDEAIFAPGLHVSPRAYRLGAKTIAPVLTPAGQAAKWIINNCKTPTVRSGGSVATVAYEVLVMLGCTEIIGVGIDCVTSHGNYADGVRPGYPGDGRGGTPIPAWGGGTVTSHPVYDHYRMFFEAATRRHQHVDHINASVLGAHIDGWREVALHCLTMTGKGPTHKDLRCALDTGEPLDWSWLDDELTAQIQGAYDAEEAGLAVVDSVSSLIENLMPLIRLGADPRAAIVGGMAIGTLGEWESLPPMDSLQALLASADRLVRGARTVRPLLGAVSSALEDDNVRAA